MEVNCQNNTHCSMALWRGALLALSLLLPLPTEALSLLPGASISPLGTTAAARPELAGTILADVKRSFSMPDGFGGNVKGYLQDRVVRSQRTGTLIFSQRIVLSAGSSTLRSLSAWTHSGFVPVTTDTDYTTDSLGNLGASTIVRGGTGNTVQFSLPRLLAAGESTYFPVVLTNSTGYAATGKTILSGPGLVNKALVTYQPSGTVQPYYAVTRTGVIGGINGSAINDHGQVVATGGNIVAGFSAYLWQPTLPNGTDGSLHPIPLLPGYSFSYGGRINTQGQIVGTNFHFANTNTDATPRAFLWTPSTANGVSGTSSDLGVPPGGTFSRASSINDSGQIVGSGDFGTILWSGGSLHLPGGLAGFAINNSGEVTGYGFFTAGTYQGYRWTPSVPNGTTGTLVSVDTIGGVHYQGPGTTGDINDTGTAIGTAQFNWPPGGETHGYSWSGSTLTDLGLNESPAAINNKGVITGTINGFFGGTLYRKGVRTLLNYFISHTLPLNVMGGFDLNSKEQIACIAESSAGYETVVLTPVKINSVTPGSVLRGSGAIKATLKGTGFLADATVLWNGSPLTTTRVSSNQLTVTVPAFLLNLPGTVSVMVRNGEGTTSNVLSFTIK